jgi:hypothetical protein
MTTRATMNSTGNSMGTDLCSVLANRWLKAPHQKPTLTERKDFMVWLLRQCQSMERDNIRPVFVSREVHLDEVIKALNRPVLPGEIRWFPVSRLFNEPHPDLMSTTQNLWFRAIHDLTHWRIQADDSFIGEFNVALKHMESAPDSIRWILFSEVAGQAAVAITNGAFPEQKLVNIL